MMALVSPTAQCADEKNAAGVTGGVNGKGEGQVVTQLLPSVPVCTSVVLWSVVVDEGRPL
ncbi:hypothetical protein G3D91_004831, partial [Salmonella enterica subsp. enterica]|nr:hypothetical protein [Salmonella enterica subsp. enterica]